MDQFNEFLALIDKTYLLLFILASIAFKKAFGSQLGRITKFTWKGVYTVGIIAFIIGIPWYFTVNKDWVVITVTYFFGTSFYEWFLKSLSDKVERFVTKILGQ